MTIDGTPYGELAEIPRTQRQQADIYRIETTKPNEGAKKLATAYTFIAGGKEERLLIKFDLKLKAFTVSLAS